MTINPTANSFNALVANMITAQSQLNTDSQQLSSGNVADDLQGYSSQAETLTAMQTLQGQITSYLNQDGVLSDKLTTQDTALQQITRSASGASNAIESAIASGNGSSLMQSLAAQFNSAVQGLNTTYDGQYIFSGGQVNTQAINVNSLSALGTASPLSNIFQNDQYVSSAQISQNTTIQTGQLASTLGTNLMSAFQAIEQFNNGSGGPFTGNLTTAQISFLQSQVTVLNSTAGNLTTITAQNGGLQSQVSTTTDDLTNYQTTMSNMIGGVTGVNEAQVAANLQQAQLAVQATAQVFLALENSNNSLLSVLAAGGQ